MRSNSSPQKQRILSRRGSDIYLLALVRIEQDYMQHAGNVRAGTIKNTAAMIGKGSQYPAMLMNRQGDRPKPISPGAGPAT